MVFRKRQISLLLFLAFFFWIPINGQDINTRIHDQTEKLKDLREKIDQYRSQLNSAKQEEQSLLDQLNSFDKDLSYTRQLVREMSRTLEDYRERITSMNEQLDRHETKLQELKDRFAKRAVQIYKQDTYQGIELLLTSSSINQAMVRLKYLRIINDANKTLFYSIAATMDSIESKKTRIQETIEKQEALLAERKTEEEYLRKQQQERRQLLSKVRQNQESLARSIQDQEEAARKLESLIADLERQREQRATQITRHRVRRGMDPSTDIESLRGELPWPARGEIVAKFGKYRHPELKTVTENTGIDIAAPKGTKVVAVLDGLVTTITWMRGYGNMIIIDHGNRYYTVYTHVMDIQVTQNSYVNTGDVIAYVGDSGSLDGAKLHFEIWGNRQKLNPEHWLTRM